jgi:hypothetical protein
VASVRGGSLTGDLLDVGACFRIDIKDAGSIAFFLIGEAHCRFATSSIPSSSSSETISIGSSAVPCSEDGSPLVREELEAWLTGCLELFMLPCLFLLTTHPSSLSPRFLFQLLFLADTCTDFLEFRVAAAEATLPPASISAQKSCS